MSSSAALDRTTTEDVAALLARTLSGGRRRKVALDSGPARGYQTDLRTVTVPYPLVRGHRLRDVTVALALQASPTKEAVASVDWPLLSRRHQRALRWVEGEHAARWVMRQWPGLGADLAAFCGERSSTPSGDDPRTLLRESKARADAGALAEPPALFGRLPPPILVDRGDGRSTAIGTRWTVRQRAKRHGALPIPVSGPGGERVTHPGEAGGLDALMGRGGRQLGIPYDEWDHRTSRYRRAYTHVLELDDTPKETDAAAEPSVHVPAFDVSRERRRGLEAGDVDIDAVVRWRCDLAAGGLAEDPRLFAALEPKGAPVAFALLVDASASSTHRGGAYLRTALLQANSLAAALGTAGHPVAAYAFRSMSRERVEVRLLEAATAPHVTFGRSLKPAGYTRLGAALRHVGRRLDAVPSSSRVLVSLGDGVPSDEGYDGAYGRADVAKAVSELELRGTRVRHVLPEARDLDELEATFGARGCRVGPSVADVEALLTELAHELRRTA